MVQVHLGPRLWPVTHLVTAYIEMRSLVHRSFTLHLSAGHATYLASLTQCTFEAHEADNRKGDA